jgi:hypothetical protein
MPIAPQADTLRPPLRALTERVVSEVRAWKESGRLALQRQKYFLRPDFSLQYSVDPTIINFPVEEGEEQVWPPDDFESFLKERIEPSSEYRDALRAVEGNPAGNTLLRALASKVAYDSALATEERGIERNLESILRDLTGGVQDYTAKIWLIGIRLTQDALQVSDLLVFRRPTRADMQEKVREYAVHYAHFFSRDAWFSCIAELRVRTQRLADMQREVDRLITALRLFRLGSVSTARYEFHTESFSPFGGGRLSGLTRAARIEYVLSPADVPDLDRFLRMLAPLLPSTYELPQRKPDFLSTALQWYGEALLAMTPIEGTVAWAISCLEALFLGDNPPSELLYRLTQRTASLLRCFGWGPLEMRKAMRIAYGVRSKYVHGAAPTKHSHEELVKLFREVAEYARVGCLIWAQLVGRDGHKRKDVLGVLEEALVDDGARGQLERWCNRVDFARKPW